MEGGDSAGERKEEGGRGRRGKEKRERGKEERRKERRERVKMMDFKNTKLSVHSPKYEYYTSDRESTRGRE